MGLYQHGAV